MSLMNSPDSKLQQTTNIKTKLKNRNDFSFADSSVSNHDRSHIIRNLYETENLNSKQDYQYTTKLYASKNNTTNYLKDSNKFKENIDNRQRIQNIYSKLNSSGINHQEIEIIKNQHRIEIQKLLLEISRLHDVIYELQLTKKTQVGRLKEQYEHLAYLNISNVKQSQQSQILILENQLKAIRNSLDFKQAENDELHKIIERQRSIYKSEIQTLQGDLKRVVQNKNNQIFKVQQQHESKMQKLNNKNNQDIQEVQQICDKQLKKLYRLVQQKQRTLQKLSERSAEYEKKNQQLMNDIQTQKQAIQEKMRKLIQKNNDKYDNLQKMIDEMTSQQNQKHQQTMKVNQGIYNAQIKNLMLIIKNKDKQIEKLHAYVQTNSSCYKIAEKNLIDEANQWKSLFKKQKQNNMRQIQELKVKMALLHQNDVKQLVNLYNTKIQTLSTQNLALQNQNTRVQKFMHEESHRWYENKKKYQIKISKLNNQITNLKAGMGDLQKNMYEKLENQRSALMLTSQNLIRDAQIKNSNVKFYEDQLRKLRNIMDIEGQNHAKIQKQLKDAYNEIENQNKNLALRNKQLLDQHNQMEGEFYQVLNEKQAQIKKLNQLTHQLLQKDDQNDNQQIKNLQETISKLQQQINQKKIIIKQQQSAIYNLQRNITDIKSENQQLFLQNQINQEQAKSQYSKIASENLQKLKDFYQRKIVELQSDKKQLILRNSAQAQNVAQLIRRYGQLQKNMQKMLIQSKKRTQLQEKIMNLGLDTNLVANKAKVFDAQYF